LQGALAASPPARRLLLGDAPVTRRRACAGCITR
jgi:hypothetical protein